MAHFKAMEGEGIGAIITAIGGLAGGAWGGIRLGKNQQLEEVKGLNNPIQRSQRVHQRRDGRYKRKSKRNKATAQGM